MKKIYLLALFLCASLYSMAALITWTGATGGTWSTSTNWSGNMVPGSLDDVLFNSSVTVVVDGAKSINSLSVTTNASVLLQGGNTSTVISIGGPVVSLIDVGSTLTLSGTTNSNRCELTMNSLSSATLSINGTLNMGDATAYSATNRLTCNNGSNVNVNGALNLVGGGSSVTSSTTANFTVSAGGIIEMKRITGGTFPIGTYSPTARLIISGLSGTAYPNFNSSQTTTWGTIEFNAPNNTATGTGGSNMFAANAICQSFKVINTGTGNATFAASGSVVRVLTVLGSLEVNAGAILNINSTSAGTNSTASGFSVAGNVLIAGTVTETGSATGSFVEMNGTTPQDLQLANISEDVSLRMSGAGLKTALTDLILPNSPFAKLVFSNGNLDVATNNKLVYIQNNKTDACLTGTASSHLIGKMKRNTNFVGNYHFPVSNNATDIPKCYVSTDAIGLSDFTVEFIDANPDKNNGLTPGTIDQVANYVWNVQRAAGGPTASLLLGYGGKAGNAIADPANAKVVHWNGSTWENKGGTEDVVSPSIAAIASDAGLNDFSPYSIGGTTGVLPVRIEYLQGSANGNENTLNWKVDCTTDPSLNIELQRSTDGVNFSTIQSQVANSVRCAQPFSYADRSPAAGKNYYRLKITQVDGATRFSSIVLLTAEGKSFFIKNLYPVPLQNSATINMQSQAVGTITVSVVDMQGRIVLRSSIAVQAGENLLPLAVSKLSAGSYLLKITDGSGATQSMKIVKQ